MGANHIRGGTLPLTYLEKLSNVFNGEKIYTVINGCNIKITSQRYAVFKNSTKCTCCGLEASFLAYEKPVPSKHNNTENYHINMYGLKDGNEILFTKDHVIPRSKGGKNIMSNYQTMCEICNCKKGNRI